MKAACNLESITIFFFEDGQAEPNFTMYLRLQHVSDWFKASQF